MPDVKFSQILDQEIDALNLGNLSGETNVYELYYWPGLPGRGEFIRLILEQANAAYRDFGSEGDIDRIVSMRATGIGFAPPFLKDGDNVIAQVPAISLYIGRKHQLIPSKTYDETRVLQLLLTVMDVVNEVHDTHHPVSVALTYEEQAVVAKVRASSFLDGRLASWLDYFSSTLSHSVWLHGSEVTIADLALFQLTCGLEYAFPKASNKFMSTELRHHQNRVAELPNIKRYLDSERRQGFNESGIFRNYPELDLQVG